MSTALLEGEPVGFVSDFAVGGELPDGLMAPAEGCCNLGVCVSYDEDAAPFERTLHLVPRDIVIGAGCRRETDTRHFAKQVEHVLASERISMRALRTLASIDVKKDEHALLEFARAYECELAFFSAEELQALEGEFSHSPFVEQTVGVGNVCERAAVLASNGGELICDKQFLDGVTIALARKLRTLRFR